MVLGIGGHFGSERLSPAKRAVVSDLELLPPTCDPELPKCAADPPAHFPPGSLAIFTVLKAGFVWSGKAGSGIVIARLPDGTWSAPSCIATGGVGFGLQIGADLSEFVVVLNSDEAISAFAKGGNLTIGGSLAAAAGPIGVGGAVNTAILNPAPMFTYSKSKGLYAGVSLEGTVLVERVSPSSVLSSVVTLSLYVRETLINVAAVWTHRKMPTRHSTVNVRSSLSLSLFNLADAAIPFHSHPCH